MLKLDHEQEKNNTGIFQRVSSKSMVQVCTFAWGDPISWALLIMFSPGESACVITGNLRSWRHLQKQYWVLWQLFSIYLSVCREIFVTAIASQRGIDWISALVIVSICLIIRKWISLKNTLTLCGLTPCQAQHNLIGCKSQVTAYEHRIIWIDKVTSNQG